MEVYAALFKAYGPQYWWPGDTPFEVMVGAVLTQNTAWSNVEKAIANLKCEGVLTPRGIGRLRQQRLAALIRPSGYFNIKARRLKSLVDLILAGYGGSVRRMLGDEPSALRSNLLAVNGVGPETADSILLYAAGRPVFAVDAYTRRIFTRHGFLSEEEGYDDFQRFFMKHLPADTALFNEYHALIVRAGKECCRKSKPVCAVCSLGRFLPQ